MPAADMTRNFVEVWNRLESADSQGAWGLFARALPLIRFEVQAGLAVSAVKHNLLDKGVIHSAEVRHPTSSLDAAGLDELKVLRERLGG